MKKIYKLLISVCIISILMSILVVTQAKEDNKTGSVCENSGTKKCIIETMRYIGPDGKSTYDMWIITSYSIDKTNNFIIFYPLEGERAGKQQIIPLSNIYIIREL